MKLSYYLNEDPEEYYGKEGSNTFIYDYNEKILYIASSSSVKNTHSNLLGYVIMTGALDDELVSYGSLDTALELLLRNYFIMGRTWNKVVSTWENDSISEHAEMYGYMYEIFKGLHKIGKKVKVWEDMGYKDKHFSQQDWESAKGPKTVIIPESKVITLDSMKDRIKDRYNKLKGL